MTLHLNKLKNKPLLGDLATFCSIGILFCLFVIWIKTITVTSIFFAGFLCLWFLKRSLDIVGWDISLKKRSHCWIYVAGISTATFVISYLLHGQNPIVENNWFGWWDQSQYLLIARNLAQFTIVPSQYLYGLGYPILGALFYNLYPTNPFLIPNLLMYLLTSWVYLHIVRQYLSEELSFLTILLMLWATQLTTFFVVPWNNSIAIVGMGILIYLGSVVREIRWTHSIIIGLVIGWVFAARYVDVFFLLPVTLYIYIREFRRLRSQIKFALLSAGVAFGIFCVILYTHQYAFGSFFKTPYHLHLQPGGHSDQSLSAFQIYRVPDHLYSLIINPYQFHHLKYGLLNTPLLGYSFFFIFSLTGFSYLIFYRQNWMIAVIFVTMLFSFVFYGSFTSTRASDLKYHCLRYFALWYPLLTLTAVLGISKLVTFSGLTKREKQAILLGVMVTILGVLFTCSYLKYSEVKAKAKMLDSSSWVVSSNCNTQAAKYAVDSVPATRWDSGVPQRPGIYFLIDLGAINEIGMVKLRLFDSSNDYPRGLEVETSVDGLTWRKILDFGGLSPSLLTDDDVQFNLVGVSARYVKLLQTKRSGKWYWSIHELEIYGM